MDARAPWRALRLFLLWSVYAAAAIAILYSHTAAAWVIRFGLVLLAAYAVRSLIGMVVELFTGPRLIHIPRAGDLAAFVESCGLAPATESHRWARAAVRRFGGDVALLGLVRLLSEKSADSGNADEAAWIRACESGREDAVALARTAGGGSPERAWRTSDAAFLVQAFVLYQQRSVERILKAGRGPMLGGRRARARFAAALVKDGAVSETAESLGLVKPKGRADRARKSAAPDVISLLFPPWILFKMGRTPRAVALAVVEVALVAYGFYGLLPQSRPVGIPVWSGAGVVFLASALAIHVHALFSLDTHALRDTPAPGPEKGGKTP